MKFGLFLLGAFTGIVTYEGCWALYFLVERKVMVRRALRMRSTPFL